MAVDTGMWPNSELFCLEWPQVQLEASEFMPNGYVKVNQGKTKSAGRILPLTARAREDIVPFLLHLLLVVEPLDATDRRSSAISQSCASSGLVTLAAPFLCIRQSTIF